MRLLILILIAGYFLSGCAEDDVNSLDQGLFACDTAPEGIDDLQTGDDPFDLAAFTGHPYTMDGAIRVYEFSQMNTDTTDWCYYYSIDVSTSVVTTSGFQVQNVRSE